ncbi:MULTISPECIES: type 1 glutamine amidotransferase domain-containing protein [Tsukamurella]|uniref:Type 1 glutamine amidotransferase n=2 Tax=Tsukamurella TaxID=2060 RepID=A0A5C5S719_9ACTN|nr:MULTISPECIES: type 1 glutamine amidotransferase domain-containing protein [Tsukamurella]NMD55393.1 type 1 glutamine amidotransferase [Tsukamurella columbiensis]TWS30650.1 type 1 glutamine amidotransferase [Tsukamurella conjunctivitidis]
MGGLDGRTIAFLAAPEGTEQVELTEPWRALREAGATNRLLSTEAGTIQAFDHLDRADTFAVDGVVGEADPSAFDALVLPGGVANPDALRTDEAAVDFVRRCAETGTPIGVICHGPWTLIEAGVVRGRTLTSYPSVRTDLVNAGATWVDQEVVVCRDGAGPIVSSRRPDDLPAFCSALVAAFA